MPEPIKRYQEFVDKIYDPNAKLDWRPESWLGERAESVTGPKYTKKDVQIFRSHVPEYKKIEKAARKNGTWLQMSDGTIWTGDPREWVMMQSEAFKKNYQENPWYTGQAEWATKVTLPDGITVDTDKVKRARYHNGEMWFSDDAGYAQYFADAVGEGGIGQRNENYETSDVRGKVFLSAIPKKGNYRYLYNNSKGDLWWDMPYDLTDNDIVRSKKIGKSKNDKWIIKSEGLNLKTDDIVNHSKKLGDDGIFMFNVMDGPVRRNIGNLPYYAVPNTGINEEMDPEGPSNSMHLEIPVNEFISQPGFTEKIKFIRGNNGNFDPNTDDKYSAIFKIDSPLFVKKGGRIHIKKKNRGSFTRWCKGKVTEECIRRGKNSSNPAIRKKATFAANARRWKHENGGILKAQEGTGNLYAPHPLSPVGIALNQAKAMAKSKANQPHLPPGVKEVVGPDGKKVAIRTEQPLQPLEQNIAEWLPGTGDAAEVGHIANDIKNGNLGTAALAAGLTFIPGNWRKVLDALIPSKKDKFLDFFQKEIGKTVKRVPVTKNDFQGVYSEGFRYLDESGKEIAHIAGSRYGDRVFVESSFMDPEFRSKGIGKQMYFDFNDQMFNKYGKTIGSNSGQHMMTLETSPGIFISPSGRMWRGLRNKGLATTENPPIVSYIMAEPKAIKSYKKYSKGGKL